MAFIELHKITSDRGDREADFHTETDEPGENRGAPVPEITSEPVWVNAALIRNFYARRNDRPGTRLTFSDGGGYAVTETKAEVKDLAARAGIEFVSAEPGFTG